MEKPKITIIAEDEVPPVLLAKFQEKYDVTIIRLPFTLFPKPPDLRDIVKAFKSYKL